MPLLQLQITPTPRELRQFAGLVIPLAGLLVALLLWLKFSQGTAAIYVGAGCAALAVVGLWRPALMRPIYIGWMVAAFPIGWTVSHVFVGVAFYLVLTPAGLVMRLIGRDPMHRRFDEEADSYWSPRTEKPEKGRYFRQW